MKVRLTPEERDRLTRFHLAFNTVEQAIKKRFSFRVARLPELIGALKAAHPIWKYEAVLRALTNLRNEVAHAGGTDALRAVPTERSIQELGQIRRSIEWLDTVGQRFRKRVESVESKATLSDVFALIRARDYSQFPVLERKAVVGLLTENGITRWLAKNSARAVTPALDGVLVRDVLAGDEHRSGYEMIAASTAVETAMQRMSSDLGLEALLISERPHSKSANDIVGIVTRWDVLQTLGQGTARQ